MKVRLLNHSIFCFLDFSVPWASQYPAFYCLQFLTEQSIPRQFATSCEYLILVEVQDLYGCFEHIKSDMSLSHNSVILLKLIRHRFLCIARVTANFCFRTSKFKRVIVIEDLKSTLFLQRAIVINANIFAKKCIDTRFYRYLEICNELFPYFETSRCTRPEHCTKTFMKGTGLERPLLHNESPHHFV